MLCYGAKDLARAYRTVRANTVKAAEEIPESQLDFAPAPGTRSMSEATACCGQARARRPAAART